MRAHHPAGGQQRAAATLTASPALVAGAPVLTADQMRGWDRATIEQHGVPERVLMEAAGRAAAAVVHARHPAGRVVAAVGRGNNGGDALVLLRTLQAWGRDVLAVPVEDAAMQPALAHGWSLPVAQGAAEHAFGAAGVIVDGLLGTGARGAPRPPYARLIHAINGSGRPVVALDGPSGVDLSDGSLAGEAVAAELTIAFAALKRGHLLWPGRGHAGRVLVVEIGLSPIDAGGATTLAVTPAWAHARVGRVPPAAHKGTMGELAVVAGSDEIGGAAVLAGCGAARGGAGKVWLVSAAANRTALQTALPEALFVDRAAARVPELLGRMDAVVAGPGIGTDAGARTLLEAVLANGGSPVLLDADALTLLAGDPSLRDAAAERPLLLTPHPAEMARLLGVPPAEVTCDPFVAAVAAAERFRATVLLKGFPSLVAVPGGATFVNLTGTSGLATGGTGDTLAGVIGAFLAFGITPPEAAATALYFCGRAAELAGRGRALLPRDLAEGLAGALRRPPPSARALPAGVLLELPPAA